MKGLRETDARYTETAVSAAEKAVDETITAGARTADLGGKLTTTQMADEFIHENGHDVSDKFLLYLRPLLGSGFPDVAQLRIYTVPKILNAQKAAQ